MYIPILPKPLITATLTLLLSTGAIAAGKHAGGHGARIGEPGKPSEATRTIEVIMTDYRFAPHDVSVMKGQTIRFVVKNRGEFVHEFNIGTPAMRAAH